MAADDRCSAEENQQHARELMLQCLEDDLGGWKVRREAGRLLMTHTTAILVAENPGADK